MFNLDIEAQNWRERLRVNGCKSDDDLDEYLDHLYCLIDDIESKGLSKENAFHSAVQQIGNEKQLGVECYKAVRPNQNTKMNVCFGLATSLLVPAYFALQALVATNATNPIVLTEEENTFSSNWLETASTSTEINDLLVGAMLTEHHNPSNLSHFLEHTFETDESNKLGLSIAIYHCQINNTSDFCQKSSLENQLTQLDSNNLEPFLYSMAHMIDLGDTQEALGYLIQGLKTDQTNDYYLDKLNLVRNKLLEIGYPSEQINWAAEVYAVNNFYNFYLKVLTICTKNSMTSNEWMQSCLNLGVRLEESGKTILANVFGYAIQRDVLQQSELHQRKLQDVLLRHETYNQVIDTAVSSLQWMSDRTIQNDIYYDELLIYGEFSSLTRALEREGFVQQVNFL